MKRTTGRPKRSASRKGRKRTPSAHSPLRDDYIVQVLNDRAVSDRDILITRQQYEDLKLCRRDLRTANLTIEQHAEDLRKSEKERLELEVNCERFRKALETLESRKDVDARHMQELTAMNAKLTKELRDTQRQGADLQQRSNQAINRLRTSLADIQSVMQYRSAVGRKDLVTSGKSLTEALNQLDSSSYFPQKSQIAGLIEGSLEQVEKVKKLLAAGGGTEDASEDLENDKLREELRRLRESSGSTSECIFALEKMREQTKLIKERLRLMEGDQPYKKTLEEYEGRLQLLISEKDMLTEHVKTLQATLSEQCAVIEHLKAIIASLSSSPLKSVKVSPNISRSPETQEASFVLSPEKREIGASLSRSSLQSAGRDLNVEIEALDRDIQMLQTSLQRALQQH